MAAGKQNQHEPAVSPTRREGWRSHSPFMLDTFLPSPQHGWKEKKKRLEGCPRGTNDVKCITHLNGISSPHRATHSCAPVTLPSTLYLFTNFQSDRQEQMSNANAGLSERNRGRSSTKETGSRGTNQQYSPSCSHFSYLITTHAPSLPLWFEHLWWGLNSGLNYWTARGCQVPAVRPLVPSVANTRGVSGEAPACIL